MKTTEERAKEWAGTPLPTSKVRELRVIDYTKGATEQKTIDIRNALSFLQCYGVDDFSCWDEFEAKFRKAIEE